MAEDTNTAASASDSRMTRRLRIQSFSRPGLPHSPGRDFRHDGLYFSSLTPCLVRCRDGVSSWAEKRQWRGRTKDLLDTSGPPPTLCTHFAGNSKTENDANLLQLMYIDSACERTDCDDRACLRTKCAIVYALHGNDTIKNYVRTS
jgi:hypothetical protein